MHEHTCANVSAYVGLYALDVCVCVCVTHSANDVAVRFPEESMSVMQTFVCFVFLRHDSKLR